MCCNMVVLDTELDLFRFAHLFVREYFRCRGDYTDVDTHMLAVERCVNTYVYKSDSTSTATVFLDFMQPYIGLFISNALRATDK